MADSGPDKQRLEESARALAQIASSEVSEAPDPQTREGVRNAEAAKRGKSASVRADECHDGWIDALVSEKGRMETRLVFLEAEYTRLLPENATLRQSERTAQANSGVAAICNIIGPGLLAYASFEERPIWKWACVSIGIALTGIAILLTFLLRLFNWPPKSSEAGD